MSKNAIVVENLSKRYLIGHRFSRGGAYKYTALRDVIGREISNFARKASDVIHGRQVVQGDAVEEFWALRDVSFDVKQGEVLGIIGRNGAGKSTLLKILSRITEPTAGRILLRGRVASLLEVGTGFHPELTGRENVFLNGAILGMTQREIRKKFDEIVVFAEVERFLDTPVKHYSSGMYVRLAFAVAAHLEPEILIVDEVLAIGDADFQKKCLGKMNEVSQTLGRTVLFVSHNMEAVLKFCTRTILMETGGIRAVGDPKEVIPAYLHSQSSSPRIVDLSTKSRPDFCAGNIRLVRVSPSAAEGGWSVPFGQRLSFDLTISAERAFGRMEIGIGVYSIRGFEVATWTNRCSDVELSGRPGMNSFRITYSDLRLIPGQYSVGIAVFSDRGLEDWILDSVMFEVITSPAAAKINAHTFGGVVVPDVDVCVLE